MDILSISTMRNPTISVSPKQREHFSELVNDKWINGMNPIFYITHVCTYLVLEPLYFSPVYIPSRSSRFVDEQHFFANALVMSTIILSHIIIKEFIACHIFDQ